GADDEALPVRRKLGRQLLEEARPDRTRTGEAHVAAEDVPELRQLVQLHGSEATSEPGRLGACALDQLGAEIRPEPPFGPAAERRELEHREDRAALADPIAGVEEGAPAGQEQQEADEGDERRDHQEKERREGDVERAQLEVDPPLRRAVDERREAPDERVTRPRLCGARGPRLRYDHGSDARSVRGRWPTSSRRPSTGPKAPTWRRRPQRPCRLCRRGPLTHLLGHRLRRLSVPSVSNSVRPTSSPRRS